MKIKGCFKGVFSGGKGYLKHRQWGGGQSGKNNVATKIVAFRPLLLYVGSPQYLQALSLSVILIMVTP